MKPNNCLIFGGAVAKLCDFGTARRIGDTRLAPRYDLPVGDKRYTALELFCGLGNDPQYFFGADLFSLGAILFELLTRQILTQMVYDARALDDLSEFFLGGVPDHKRKDKLDSLLPTILSKWAFPDLRSVENLAPPSIRDRVNVFCKRLADLDYRNRAKLSFDWIFREIEICVKILDNEDKYQRWLEFKRATAKPRPAQGQT